LLVGDGRSLFRDFPVLFQELAKTNVTTRTASGVEVVLFVLVVVSLIVADEQKGEAARSAQWLTAVCG